MAARNKGGQFVKNGTKSRSDVLSARNIARGLIIRAVKEANRYKEPTLVSVGRRIVEVDTLARALWCPPCDRPLSLRHMEEERQIGLVSFLKVRCQDCLAVYKVHTSKKVPNQAGYSLYASNCKAALGCLDTGMGSEVLNKFLPTLNIPVLHHSTYKRAHDFVGNYVIQTADQSCKDAIAKEKRLSLELLLEKGIPGNGNSNSKA